MQMVFTEGECRDNPEEREVCLDDRMDGLRNRRGIVVGREVGRKVLSQQQVGVGTLVA